MILGFAALAFMPMFFLFWLMQPKVLANPGTAVRAVPRIVYAEPPPADLGLLQASDAPMRDVMPLRQSEAQLRQARAAKHEAYRRVTRVRLPKAHAARTLGAKIDASRVATRQMHPIEMARKARSWQHMTGGENPNNGNRIVPANSIDRTCASSSHQLHISDATIAPLMAVPPPIRRAKGRA
jgi:hypothetical protein